MLRKFNGTFHNQKSIKFTSTEVDRYPPDVGQINWSLWSMAYEYLIDDFTDDDTKFITGKLASQACKIDWCGKGISLRNVNSAVTWCRLFGAVKSATIDWTLFVNEVKCVDEESSVIRAIRNTIN